jgi:hypothetical protein
MCIDRPPRRDGFRAAVTWISRFIRFGLALCLRSPKSTTVYLVVVSIASWCGAFICH